MKQRPVAKGTAILSLTALVLFQGDVQSQLSSAFPESWNLSAVILPADLEKAPTSALFHDLARPSDTVSLGDDQKLSVAPLADFLGDANSEKSVPLLPLNKEPSLQVKRGEIKAIEYYEERALLRVEQLLAKDGPHAQLGQDERLQAAERILRAALHFHLANRNHPLTPPDPWEPLRARLTDRLAEVRRVLFAFWREQAQSDLERARVLAWADELLRLYPQHHALREEVRETWMRHAGEAVKSGAWPSVRPWLDRLEQEFPLHASLDTLRASLSKEAEALAKKAQSLPDDQAARVLDQAVRLCPSLPGLVDEWHRKSHTYRILLVAVRNLPVNLSPATAWTDSEKMAVALQFENLVRFDGKKHGPLGGFHPVLARELPRTEPLLRHFALRRNLHWSDGGRITAEDIRHTDQLLVAAGPGLAPGRDLFEPPRIETDPFHIDFPLRHGLLEPLDFLEFPVLPQRFHGKALTKADDADFATHPVGSGPFLFAGRKEADGRTYAVFRANPYYIREGLPLGPAIREIRFFAWSGETAKTWQEPWPHVIVDPAFETMIQARLRKYPPAPPTLEPRAYFLAINHRVPTLANVNLRRFLAHALDRDALLDDHFRAKKAMPGITDRLHRPLTGLFPSGSWMICPPPRVPESLFQPELARSFAKMFQAELGPVELTLRFPDDDPRVGAACTAIIHQWESRASDAGAQLKIKLVTASPHQLRDKLLQHDYALAYHYLDHPESFGSLRPLFDPRPASVEPGGTNFLGYENDIKLVQLFRAALGQRHFAAVQEFTQALHAHLFERMPLVPLWQLHRFHALHPSVIAEQVEPLGVFSNVAAWKIKTP